MGKPMRASYPVGEARMATYTNQLITRSPLGHSFSVSFSFPLEILIIYSIE